MEPEEEEEQQQPEMVDPLQDPRNDDNAPPMGEDVTSSSLPQEKINQFAKEEERSSIFETRLQKAEEFWEEGKVKFRELQYEIALDKFQRGIYHSDFDELQYNFELMDKHREAVDSIRLPLWLNCAACYIKLKQPKDAIENCDKVLKHDPNHVKALYRRAKAKEELGKDESALEDLDKALKLAKDDQEVLKAALQLRKRIQQAQKASDDIWRGKMKLPPKVEVAQTEHQFILVRWFLAVIAWIISIFNLFKQKIKAS
jgi:tetratricopeptide (TPR) repeat protein